MEDLRRLQACRKRPALRPYFGLWDCSGQPRRWAWPTIHTKISRLRYAISTLAGYTISWGGGSEPVTRAVAAVSKVYEVAKAGGPHHGWLEKQRKLPTAKLFTSIRSLEKQIALHYKWINDPYLKVPLETPSGEVDYYAKIK
ncbi:MAG: hypothetical protein U1F76_03615 [Candidatus Competibacteraceae bacterium]